MQRTLPANAKDLASLLPQRSTFIPKRVKEFDRFPGLLVQDPIPPANYIEPQLQSADFVSLDQIEMQPLVLIAAAGALGKSSLALYLSHQSKNPLWLLQNTNLGDATLAGLVTEIYGTGATHDFFGQLNRGDVCLLLDSLDEALIRPNPFGVLTSFSNDLKVIIEEVHATCPAIVVLGRVESIAMLHLELAHKDVPHSVLEISYFDLESATQYVEQRGSHDRDSVQKVFQSVLALTGSGNCDDLAQAWSDATVRSFLGYAPVLSSIAKLLDTDEPEISPRRRREEVDLGEHEYGLPDYWASLVGLCSSIMDREIPKVESGLRSAMEIRGPVYSNEEQAESVLAHVCAEEHTRYPEWLQGEEIAAYLQATESQLKSHPFLNQSARPARSPSDHFANVIFFEYVLAYAALCLEESEFLDRLSCLGEWGSYSPSPIFGRVLLRLAQDSQRAVPSYAAGLLIASLSAARSIDRVPHVMIESPGGGDRSRLLVSVVDDASIGGSIDLAEAEEGRLVLSGEVGDLTIDAPWLEVQLGSSISDLRGFLVSGSVSIECKDLEVATPQIAVSADARLRLAVQGKIVDGRHRQPSVSTSGQLIVLCPEDQHIPYPWRELRNGPPPVRSGNLPLQRHAETLRKLINNFFRVPAQGTGIAGNTCYAGGFEAAVKASAKFNNDIHKMLEFALMSGLLEKFANNGVYLLKLDVADLSMDAIRSADYLDPALDKFLEDFDRQMF